MATYVSYSIRIEGRLKGTPQDNEADFKKLFLTIFPEDPQNAKLWVDDFLPRGLKIVHWLSSQSEGGKEQPETIWSFFVQTSTVRPGKMADKGNCSFLEEHHKALLCYRTAQWYLHLRSELTKMNGDLQGKLIERVWFREQTSCDGDGGDM